MLLTQWKCVYEQPTKYFYMWLYRFEMVRHQNAHIQRFLLIIANVGQRAIHNRISIINEYCTIIQLRSYICCVMDMCLSLWIKHNYFVWLFDCEFCRMKTHSRKMFQPNWETSYITVIAVTDYWVDANEVCCCLCESQSACQYYWFVIRVRIRHRQHRFLWYADDSFATFWQCFSLCLFCANLWFCWIALK